MQKRVTLKIYGMVQGVGFRYSSQKEAKKRGFSGHVKNLDDGSIGLIVEGEESDLQNFIQWCYNGVGPAMVTKIEPNWSVATGEFSDFRIS
jgi:acylphosphatase